ncbi:hypothetical protein [Flavobacterium hiemivividum]|uniref:Lipoprotein n=1 Tax=Flavobacterium hiemivividum TaxID=2541734 RepID=A0A4R5D3V7_9FLAO|nr:hypothetical protein [Flavobacterium hiemivividum]TDE06181.1 hypothetical protein E0F98_00745 [Flavobacterium hiemivividum]
MKKYFYLLVVLIIASSCQVNETIYLNEDGSGTIEVVQLRDEHSYMQLVGGNYSREEKFVDTTYAFKDYITKYSDNYSRLPAFEKAIFNKFKDIKVYIKKSSYEKEFRTVISQKFGTIEAVPDLYKTENYASDLAHNYALSAEEHYYAVSYSFDGTIFRRIVSITDSVQLQKEQSKISEIKKQFSTAKISQSYVLNYHFLRKIKSVSNPNAKISEDRKALKIEFLLGDCLQNPEITALEVVLE